MIKPEDLRIGDLVMVSRDCTFPKGTMCAVTDIRPEKEFKDKKGVVTLSYMDGTEDGPWGTWCCNIEGVPITPEILEKNGWEKKIFYLQLQKSVRERYEYRLPGTDLIIDYRPYIAMDSQKFSMNYDYVKLKYIQYVHELQHILWVLGLDAKLKIK